MDAESFFYSYKEQTETEKAHVFLESGRGGHFTIAAWNPLATAQSVENGLLINWRNGEKEVLNGEPLALLEELVEKYHLSYNDELPVFQGGAIGFVAYDYARKIEVLPNTAVDDLHVPDIYFYIFDCWAVHDVKTNKVTLMKLADCDVDLEERANAWQGAAQEGLLTRKFEKTSAVEIVNDESELLVSFAGTDFEDAVSKIQTYIAQGDVFQVNLSVRQSKKLNATAMDVYEALRAFNPSPYMAYIEAPDFAVVSGSPELLVKRHGTELSTRPIAGTRPRGKSEAEDLALAQELIDNDKERAEHVMLVDLERNDLGRVSTFGTVEVDEFMVIERYSHVMHIVSNVRGEIAEGKTNADVIRAMFPGGTITGAPKIRTMEIIEELEPVRRGLYTGSIGWLGYTGDMEFNIVIRTAFVKDGVAHIQAGAGIVIDSVPEKEYQESLNKAKAMWQAKAMAEERAK
ncbi:MULTISPECIES: anthranilate synthase component I family protein [unclassified Lysinibacillus]|uniref:anthranilate synthase component I family protein n=1 Tax=unclassified Lysinibacillus TaxID=2636778 RepID=UPI0025561633|nr:MULTISPECIES: anthranilate synthase component I family protein [unclassified Lysinibacillus]MDM5245872.1 anthranilate synthase component I family protein [Lysinibacillus sp. G4S2]